MSDYVFKKGAWAYNQIKPRYDMLILNSESDYEEPTLLIIDRINANEYRFKLQTIIETAKKEELINRN